MKKVLAILFCVFALAGCVFDHTSDVVSNNLSNAADNYQLLRRVVFYNGITGGYMLTIEGFCSLGNHDAEGTLSVTCKVGDGYKKLFLGLSDNVTYFVDQLDAANVDPNHYVITFKPTVIVPDIDVK